MGKLVLMNGIYYMQDSISGELTPIDRIPDQEINSATPETKGGVVIADNLDEDESNPLAVPNAQLVKTLLTDLKTSLNTEFDSKLEEKLNTEEFASRFSEALAQSDINVDQLKGLIKLANLPATSIPDRVDVASDASRLALTTEQVQLGDHVYVIDTKKYYVVVDDTKLNTKEGYLEYNASVEWSSILNIPEAFKPEAHTHQLSDITDAQEVINKLSDTFNTKFETKTSTLENSVSTLETSVENLRIEQNSQTSKINKVSESLETVSNNVTANSTSIEDINTNLSTLETKASTLGTSVSTLETKTSTLETSVSTLENSVSNLTSQKVNISDLEGLVSINGTNASSAKHEIVTKKNNKNLTAKIWNESSGGGLQFINEDANIISFLGINNGSGDSDIWAQFYAKYIDNNGDQIKNKGTRVNFTNHGIYMTMDKTNSSYTENDLLVTKNDLNSLVSQDTLQETKKEITEAFENVSDSIEDANNASDSVRLSLSDRISLLERKLQDMKVTNVATSNLNEDISDTNVDIVSNGSSVHSVIRNVTAKSISLTNANVESGRFNLKADDDISIKNLNTSGNLAKVVSNAGVSINTDGYVTINDSNYSQIGYNGIEIGLSNTAPKSVLIDNIDFTANMSNNAILVLATQDNAVITISNCHFASVSDMLRISNRTNATGVVINIINCVIDKTDDNPQWGLILCEDYLKGTHDEVVERNLFSPDKITINIINTYMNGKKITENIINSTSEPSVITVWNNYENSTDREKAVADFVDASDTTRYPKVVIS